MGHMDGAHLWKRVADAQWSAGEDPSEAYGRAIHAANASLMANPEDPFMLQLLADSLWCMGELQAENDEDPSECCFSSTAAYERALAIRPEDAGLWNGRCNALRVLGEWLSSQGQDPTQPLGQAVESGDRAVAHSQDLRCYYGRARASLALVTWMVRRGELVDLSVERGLQFGAILRTRPLNSAESGWLTMRDFHDVRRWRASLLALEQALRVHSARADLLAVAEAIRRAREVLIPGASD